MYHKEEGDSIKNITATSGIVIVNVLIIFDDSEMKREYLTVFRFDLQSKI